MTWFNPSSKRTTDPFMNQDNFQKEYLNKIVPHTLVEWLEDLCNQLDCPEPNPMEVSGSEYFKRYGAWETQMLILKKLRYAIAYEKSKEKNEKNNTL